MNATQLKTQYLKARTQFVLFNDLGDVLDSCNTIIDFSAQSETLFRSFLFLEGLMDELQKMQVTDNYILCPMVEAEIEGQKYIFDYQLKCAEDGESRVYLWIIHNNTERYLSIMKLKQSLNTTLLKNDPTRIVSQ